MKTKQQLIKEAQRWHDQIGTKPDAEWFMWIALFYYGEKVA